MKTITFQTANSIYEMQMSDNEEKVKVTKVGALNPESTFIAVGQTFESRFYHVKVGEPALFDGVRTSIVEQMSISNRG